MTVTRCDSCLEEKRCVEIAMMVYGQDVKRDLCIGCRLRLFCEMGLREIVTATGIHVAPMLPGERRQVIAERGDE